MLQWLLGGGLVAFLVWIFATGGSSKPAAGAKPRADDAESLEDRLKRWEAAGPLPLKQLTRQQYECLSELTQGAILRLTPKGPTVNGQPPLGFNGRTVTSLMKHAFVRDERGHIVLTDLGRVAYEKLPTRW